jgi:hypothetical protein
MPSEAALPADAAEFALSQDSFQYEKKS